MKRKMLSIDFDYFVAADNETRDALFPTPHEGYRDLDDIKIVWDERYEQYERELLRVGIDETFSSLKAKVLSTQFKAVRVEESHQYAYDFAKLHQIDYICHVDFHHDFFHCTYSSEAVNCGNWLRKYFEIKPKCEVDWVRHSTSELRTLEGFLPFNSTIDPKVMLQDWNSNDVLFVCKSSLWTPPHLYSHYDKFVAELFKSTCYQSA